MSRWEVKWGELSSNNMHYGLADMERFVIIKETINPDATVEPGDVFNIDDKNFVTILCPDSRIRLFGFVMDYGDPHNRWNDIGVASHPRPTVRDLIKSLGPYSVIRYYGKYAGADHDYPTIWEHSNKSTL